MCQHLTLCSLCHPHRNRNVDIVQAVGRVMRKAPGKQYGYIVLPVAIPRGVDPTDAPKQQ